MKIDDNRWIPENNEVAKCFSSESLSGFFTKKVKVPSGFKMLVFSQNKNLEYSEGEYNLSGPLKASDLLIYKINSFPITFAFSALSSKDDFAFEAKLSLQLIINNTKKFKEHFLYRYGVVGQTELNNTLWLSLDQFIKEFCNSKTSVELLGKDPQSDIVTLRRWAEHSLSNKNIFLKYGLALMEITAISFKKQKNSLSSVHLFQKENIEKTFKEKGVKQNTPSIVFKEKKIPAPIKKLPINKLKHLEEFIEVKSDYCPIMVPVILMENADNLKSKKQLPKLNNIISVSKDPITVKQFAFFMKMQKRNEDRWRVYKQTQDFPMTNISISDCLEWLEWYNQWVIKVSNHQVLHQYRLLTEEEWRYCCMAGIDEHYLIGSRYCEDIDWNDAVYRYSEINRSRKRASNSEVLTDRVEVTNIKNSVNSLNLRGMHGNVWEWVSSSGAHFYQKGGSFLSSPNQLSSSYKIKVIDKSHYAQDVGFRICKTIDRLEI